MNVEIRNGLLEKPVCAHCGYQVPNDCVIGSGCPVCHQRLFPSATPPPVNHEAEKDAELAALKARVAELEGEAGG